MNKTLITLIAAAGFGLGSTAFAASHTGAPMSGAAGSATTTTPSTGGAAAGSSMSGGSTSTTAKAGATGDTKAMKKQAEADYKAAKALCKPMKGDEAKACTKDAKAAHEKAEADMKRAQADAKASKKAAKAS